jgi:hypothetical protein
MGGFYISPQRHKGHKVVSFGISSIPHCSGLSLVQLSIYFAMQWHGFLKEIFLCVLSAAGGEIDLAL